MIFMYPCLFHILNIVVAVVHMHGIYLAVNSKFLLEFYLPLGASISSLAVALTW